MLELRLKTTENGVARADECLPLQQFLLPALLLLPARWRPPLTTHPSLLSTVPPPTNHHPPTMQDLGFGFALRSTDGGLTFDPTMINLDGPWLNQSSMFPKGEPMQTLEISPFETAAGDILVLDRPASSPW